MYIAMYEFFTTQFGNATQMFFRYQATTTDIHKVASWQYTINHYCLQKMTKANIMYCYFLSKFAGHTDTFRPNVLVLVVTITVATLDTGVHYDSCS